MLINPLTAERLKLFAAHPAHALIIFGADGSGALKLAEQSLKDLGFGPKVLNVAPEEGKLIGIEKIRQATEFLKIKSDTRVVLIEKAELLTEEAQNALLKTLEEPSEGSLIVLVSSNPGSLLPTIRSRADLLEVLPISLKEAKQAYPDANESEINKNLLLSDGGAELFELLMTGQDHPLIGQIESAKQFLTSSTFEKLAQIDKLKDSADTLISALTRIAKSTLQNKGLSNAQRRRWISIYESSAQATEQLKANVSKKSVLLKLCLEMK